MNKDKMKEARYAINTRMFLMFMGIMLVMNALMSTSRYGRSWIQIANDVSEAEKNGTLNLEEPSTEAAKETASAQTEAVKETTAEESKAEKEKTAEEAAAEIEKAADAAAYDDMSGADEEENETGVDVNELARQMKIMGITVNDLKMLGILYLIVAVIELVSGLICIIFSNRVDRSQIVWIAVLVLLAGEIILILVSAMKSLLMLSTVIYSVLILGILLRQAWKLRKFAKEDPKRVFVIEPAGRNTKSSKGGYGQNTGENNSSSDRRRTENAPTPVPGGRSLHDRAMMQAPGEPEEASANEMMSISIDVTPGEIPEDPIENTPEDAAGKTEDETAKPTNTGE